MVMHGSGQNSAQTRKWTGYGFERLADERGFAVVYPDGYEGYWNACNIVGDYSANKLKIDDVGFLTGWSTNSSPKSVSIRTAYPINPIDGGEVTFLGLLKRGKVRSSRDSGQYLADLNNPTGTPETSETQVTDGFHVERVIWRNESKIEVELVAIHGGGHGIPQPYWRYPRLLGPARPRNRTDRQ